MRRLEKNSSAKRVRPLSSCPMAKLRRETHPKADRNPAARPNAGLLQQEDRQNLADENRQSLSLLLTQEKQPRQKRNVDLHRQDRPHLAAAKVPNRLAPAALTTSMKTTNTESPNTKSTTTATLITRTTVITEKMTTKTPTHRHRLPEKAANQTSQNRNPNPATRRKRRAARPEVASRLGSI